MIELTEKETSEIANTEPRRNKDYLMMSLYANLTTALHLVCSRMQEKTPYGKAYQKAYTKISKIRELVDDLDELLKDCADLYAKKEEEK